jgi:hypothetical protein
MIYLTKVYINGQFVETFLTFYDASSFIKRIKLEQPEWEYSIQEQYI